MATYLQLINEARKRNKMSSLSLTQAQAEENANYIIDLNDTIREIIEDGTDWSFRNTILNVDITPSTTVVSVPNGSMAWDPQSIKNVWLLNADDSIDKELTLITYDYYNKIKDDPDVNLTEVTHYFVEYQTLNIYPAPTTNQKIKIKYQPLIENVSAADLGTSMSMPDRIKSAISKGLYAIILSDQGDGFKYNIERGKYKKMLEKAKKVNNESLREKGMRPKLYIRKSRRKGL